MWWDVMERKRWHLRSFMTRATASFMKNLCVFGSWHKLSQTRSIQIQNITQNFLHECLVMDSHSQMKRWENARINSSESKRWPLRWKCAHKLLRWSWHTPQDNVSLHGSGMFIQTLACNVLLTEAVAERHRRHDTKNKQQRSYWERESISVYHQPSG